MLSWFRNLKTRGGGAWIPKYNLNMTDSFNESRRTLLSCVSSDEMIPGAFASLALEDRGAVGTPAQSVPRRLPPVDAALLVRSAALAAIPELHESVLR